MQQTRRSGHSDTRPRQNTDLLSNQVHKRDAQFTLSPCKTGFMLLSFAKIAIYLQTKEMAVKHDFAISTYDTDLKVRMFQRLTTSFTYRG